MDNTNKTDDEKKLKDGQVVAVLWPYSDADFSHELFYAITKDESIVVFKRHLIIKGDKVTLTYPRRSGLTYEQQNIEKIELAQEYLKGMVQYIEQS